MIVVFTGEADTDLERIADFIAEDNTDRAASFVRELVDRCQSLADAPLRIPLLAAYEQAGVRPFACRNYLIFYRLGDQRIEILHALHGARDYEAILSRRR